MKLGTIWGFIYSEAYTNMWFLFNKKKFLLFNVYKKKDFMGILLVSHLVSWKTPMQKWDLEAYMP